MAFRFNRFGSERVSRAVVPRDTMIALISVLCIVVLGHDLYQTWAGRSREIEVGRREAVNLAWSAAQNARDAFLLADVRLLDLVERVEAEGTGAPQLERLRRLMRLQIVTLPILQSLTLIDAAGNVVVNDRPVTARVNVADRKFFQHHQTDADRGTYTSDPLHSRVTGNWVVALSRRVDHTDGSFAGILTATIDVSTFQKFYATLDLGHDGVAALIRSDGTLMVRQPGVELAIGRITQRGPALDEMFSGKQSGTFEISSPIDGVKRIYAFRAVAEYPLIAVIALAKDEILANWWTGAFEHLITAMAAVSLLSFFAIKLRRQMGLLARAGRDATAAAERFRSLADTATEMIVTFDPLGVHRYVSPASFELLGYKPEEMIGKPAETWFHPDEAADATACLHAMAAGQERDRLTYRLRHRDGHWVWVETTFTLVRDPESGAPRAVNAALRDVGERIATEAAFRESEERYRLLLQSNVIEAVYMLDPDGKIESWNAAAERIKGYTSAEIIGQNFAIFFTAEDIANGEPISELAIARDTGRYITEAWRVRKDGTRFLARVALEAIHRDDGTLRGFAKVTYDITTQRIEEEQRAIIIEAAPNGMMIVDEAGKITLVNSEVERIFDYPSGALVGQKIEILVADGFRAAHGALRSAFTSGRSDKEMAEQRQFAGRKRDGGAVSVEIMLNAIKTPRGRVVVASLFDVTERLRLAAGQREREEHERLVVAANNAKLERLARHLAKARDQADEANKAKSRFLTGMTHELRTPLHGILGYAEMLSLEGGLNPTQVERLAAMMTAGEHLLGMINSVLDVSQIEADRLELHPDEIEFPDFARTCLDVVRPGAELKGLAVALVAADPVRIVADPVRLRQVLINLLGNAVKFTRSGSIELRVRRVGGATEAGDRLRLEVADTGPGILEQHRDKLFQTFERLNANAVSGIEGSGLGLALAARLVGLMGGRIGHVDNPGGGSVFWLELPAGGIVPASAGTAAAPGGADKRRLRILVVDDEALNRNIASGFLRFGGHQVECVDNGAAAVEMAAAAHFDVILMDVRMGGMNGLEATRRIRALPAPHGTVPVVAVTAQAFAEQIEICRQAGMDTHVSKPFTKAGLLAAVEKISSPSIRAAIPAIASHPGTGSKLPVFDRDIFDDITALLPARDVMDHLGSLVARCDTMLATLGLLRTPGQAGDLADPAHALGGTAGTLGCVALAHVARRFEFAAGKGTTDMADLFAEFAVVIEATATVLRKEHSEMVAAAPRAGEQDALLLGTSR